MSFVGVKTALFSIFSRELAIIFLRGLLGDAGGLSKRLAVRNSFEFSFAMNACVFRIKDGDGSLHFTCWGFSSIILVSGLVVTFSIVFVAMAAVLATMALVLQGGLRVGVGEVIFGGVLVFWGLEGVTGLLSSWSNFLMKLATDFEGYFVGSFMLSDGAGGFSEKKANCVFRMSQMFDIGLNMLCFISFFCVQFKKNVNLTYQPNKQIIFDYFFAF